MGRDFRMDIFQALDRLLNTETRTVTGFETLKEMKHGR
jgi:hypothetical protein